MNILFMNSSRTWGGTEKWTKMASEAIAKELECKTFLVYRRDVVSRKFTIPKFRLPCMSHIDLFTLFGLVSIIRKEKIDIVIPTKRKDYLIAGIAARYCGIKNILRLGIERRLRIPFFHRLIYHTLADGIIVNAEKIKRTLLLSPFIDAGTTKVIHNGVDNLNIDSLAEIPASKPFPFVVVAVGVLTDRKGFDFLMNGFAAFTRNHPNINPGLIIMGDGPKKDELQKLAVKLGIENRTVFTGFVDNPYRYMTIGDVIAMTSKNEGISNALIEGMYLGNVPVSTFAGGSEELIMDGRNGFLVEYGDSGRLEGVLSELAENREIRKRLSSAAKETVKAGFSLDVMQREMIDFCRSIKDAE